MGTPRNLTTMYRPHNNVNKYSSSFMISFVILNRHLKHHTLTSVTHMVSLFFWILMNGNIVQNTGQQRLGKVSAQPLDQMPEHSSMVHMLPMNSHECCGNLSFKRKCRLYHSHTFIPICHREDLWPTTTEAEPLLGCRMEIPSEVCQTPSEVTIRDPQAEGTVPDLDQEGRE